MTATRRIRPPIKRHGGKYYLAPRIVALMPPHRTYVEPFVGGGSVLLSKPTAEVEVAADLDAGLIGMWRWLADPDVPHNLDQIAYTEAAFRHAASCLETAELGGICASNFPLSYIVRSRFSRGGLGKTFAWSDRLRGGQPGDANAWDTFRRVDLPAICERVRGVTFLHRNARWVIEDYDTPDALFYCDPPYVHATRTAREAYEHEMGDDDHRGVLAMLNGCKAKVMLSGYRCEMYDDALAGWRRVDFDMPNHSGQGKAKQRRVECLWMNFAATAPEAG